MAALGLTQPALAETVVLKCTATSNAFGGIMPGGIALAYYKIGDGSWLRWNVIDNKWGNDYCKNFLGNSSHCSFDNTKYTVSSALENGNANYALVIDRMSGNFTITADYTFEPHHFQDDGTCEISTDPPPPPPPPPKPKF